MKYIRLTTTTAAVLSLMSMAGFALAEASPASALQLSKSPISGPIFSIGTTVQCPPSIIAAATNAPSPWYPGAVTLSFDTASLTHSSAPVPQMLCKYSGSGSSWMIARPISPEFKSCVVTPTGKQFLCKKT